MATLAVGIVIAAVLIGLSVYMLFQYAAFGRSSGHKHAS